MEDFPVVTHMPDEIFQEEEYERLYSAPAEIVTLLSIFYGGISIIAVIGNALVIWVVTTTRNMHTVTNMYIANLAFADVFIGMFCIPFQFQAALLQRWNLPNFMCAFCPFVQVVSVNVSVFTLTAIAIDRHRAIINPLRARPTKFISKIIIGGIWLISLAFAVPCVIAFRVVNIEERIRENDVVQNVTRPFCDLNLSKDQLQTYRYLLVFFQYLVPFCVISFVYIQMAVKLWGTRAPGNAQDSRDMTLLRNKKKVIKMLIIVVAVFGLCWLPLQTYNILYVTIPEVNDYRFINIIFFCCDWLAMSNSCYNPFIYGIYNEKFKREFNNRFAVCFCKFKTTLDSHERTMSMHTRASSIRSTYANSSTRIRNNVNLGHNHNQQIQLQHQNQQQQQHLLRNARETGVNGLSSGGGVGGFELKNQIIPTSIPFNTITYFDDRKAFNENKRLTDYDMMTNNCSTINKTNNGQWKRQHYGLSFNASPIVYGDDIITTLNLSNDDNDMDDSRVIDDSSSTRCVCENELNERNGCDGSCILNQMAQVRNVGNVEIVATPDSKTFENSTRRNDQTKALIAHQDDSFDKKSCWYPIIHVNKMSNDNDLNDDDDDDDDVFRGKGVINVNVNVNGDGTTGTSTTSKIKSIDKNEDDGEQFAETEFSEYAMLKDDMKFRNTKC